MDRYKVDTSDWAIGVQHEHYLRPFVPIHFQLISSLQGVSWRPSMQFACSTVYILMRIKTRFRSFEHLIFFDKKRISYDVDER